LPYLRNSAMMFTKRGLKETSSLTGMGLTSSTRLTT
jgi:hypothetical protein